MGEVVVDWSQRAEHVWHVHDLDPRAATEAVNDGAAVWIDPDPASESGQSLRVIGYSTNAGVVLTVILVRAEFSKPLEADHWGSNAWRANKRDRRIYEQGKAAS